MPLYRPPVSPMARINVDLPSHVARGLFFALRHVGGVRRGPIRHHGHHGQRRSVFERLGPRLRRTAAHGHGHGPYGRIFDSAVRDVRADVRRRRWSPIRRGRLASPQDRPLQNQPPSPRLGADGAGPSNTAPPAVEVAAPPVVEAPMPLAEAVEMMPAAAPTPSYMPMEPMSPVPAPPRYWCDFCKEYTSIPHTLEYAYSMPTPTPPTTVAPGNGVPPLDPWFLNTQAAPALDAVKVEDEVDVVAAPGVGNLFNLGDIFNTAARTGISPYFFLDRAGPSAPPPASAGPSAPPPPATHEEAAAHMKEQALPAVPPSSTEGTATTPQPFGVSAVVGWPRWIGAQASAGEPGARQRSVSHPRRSSTCQCTAAASSPTRRGSSRRLEDGEQRWRWRSGVVRWINLDQFPFPMAG